MQTWRKGPHAKRGGKICNVVNCQNRNGWRGYRTARVTSLTGRRQEGVCRAATARLDGSFGDTAKAGDLKEYILDVYGMATHALVDSVCGFWYGDADSAERYGTWDVFPLFPFRFAFRDTGATRGIVEVCGDGLWVDLHVAGELHRVATRAGPPGG